MTLTDQGAPLGHQHPTSCRRGLIGWMGTMGVPWGYHGASPKAREASAKDVRDPFLWQGVGVPSASQHWMVELDGDHGYIGGLGPSH